MTASERFRKYLAGEPVDRCPVIEWAPWWNLTVERWREEGLPANVETVEQIQDYFGLDKCLQTGIRYRTKSTPAPAEHGKGIVSDESDWERVKQTMFPPVETLISEEKNRISECDERAWRYHSFSDCPRILLVSAEFVWN